MMKKLFITIIAFFTIIQPVYAEEEYYSDGYIEEVTAQEEIIYEEMVYTNQETGYTAHIFDEADLITSEQELELLEEMKPLTEYGHIAFQTINENYTSTSYYAETRYHNLFGTSSGTLFVIDMDNRQIYIFSDGQNYRYVTNSKARIITDNVYRDAKREDYYGCASNTFKQIHTILEGGKIAEPMRHISNYVIALILSFFIGFIIVMSKTSIAPASNYTLLKNCNINFATGDVKVLKTGTHKVYCPPSDSGSGFSGGGGGFSGGGGGGGSSGGGGGHGF